MIKLISRQKALVGYSSGGRSQAPGEADLVFSLPFLGFGLGGAGLGQADGLLALGVVPSLLEGTLGALVPVPPPHTSQLSNLYLQSAQNSFFQLQGRLQRMRCACAPQVPSRNPTLQSLLLGVQGPQVHSVHLPPGPPFLTLPFFLATAELSASRVRRARRRKPWSCMSLATQRCSLPPAPACPILAFSRNWLVLISSVPSTHAKYHNIKAF